MAYGANECERARRDFPALEARAGDHPVAFLDGPGGTQVPQGVIDAVARCYRSRNANFDGAFETSRAVTSGVNAAREAVADFLGAPGPETVSFGANMTTLNFALSHAIGRAGAPGDEVVVTALDHEANRGPWLRLAERGLVIREARITAQGELDLDHLAAQIGPRTRAVAVTLASNALGTVPDLAVVRGLAERVGAWLVLDAVHYAAHFPVDVVALEADFLLCSAYKFYGPHIGILYARRGLLDGLDPDRLRTAKAAAPWRIETGTLNHPAIEGVRAAIDYLAGFGQGADRRARLVDAMSGIAAWEHALAARLHEGLASLPAVNCHGPGFGAGPRAPTVSVTLDGTSVAAAAAALGAQGLQLWHGHFYAARVMESLGVEGMLRTGLSMYNTPAEIDRLLAAVAALRAP